MFSKGSLKTVCIVAAASVLVVACGSTPKSSGAAAKPNLTIGISVSLTGDFSNSGAQQVAGYKVWAAAVNAEGGLLGRHVVLTFADDASSPTQVVTNCETFISQDHVNLLFGPFSTLLTLPAAKVALRYHYSFIESGGGGPSMFAAHLPNLFYVAPNTAVNGGLAWGDYILSLPASQRPKTAAYVSLDDPFSEPVAAGLQKLFEAHGIKTVYSTIYPAATTDLAPVMAAAAATHPDMVVSGSQDADGWAQVRAMIQLHFSPKFLFMANGPEDVVNFPKQVGVNNTQGILTPVIWTAQAKTYGNKEFIKAYIKMYGGTVGDINSTSAQAYAQGQTLQYAVHKTGKIDNQTIITTLHHSTWSTVLGPISVNEWGAPISHTGLLEEWVNGALDIVYPPSTAQVRPLVPKPPWGSGS